MKRKIKFEKITMKNGEAAILSTVELEPDLYETLLASPDFGVEYAQLRTTSEAQAIADFKHLHKQYAVEPLTGKYSELAKDLECAAAHGMECAAGTEDGGTCNMDAVAVSLKGWNREKIEQAAKAAGVGCFVWNLYGHKYFVFPIRSGYQGNARTRAAEAMCEALKLSGYKVEMYYQID